MQSIGTRKSRRWMAAALVAFLLVGSFLLGDYDVATGIWMTFGAVIPWEWPLMAFGFWVLIAVVLGLLFGWAAGGTADAKQAAGDDGTCHGQAGDTRL